MSQENQKLIQFTKNKTKFTIIKLDKIEDNNINTVLEQNSNEINEEEEEENEMDGTHNEKEKRNESTTDDENYRSKK